VSLAGVISEITSLRHIVTTAVNARGEPVVVIRVLGHVTHRITEAIGNTLFVITLVILTRYDCRCLIDTTVTALARDTSHLVLATHDLTARGVVLGTAVEITATVTVDTAHPCLIVHIWRCIIKGVTVIVLIQEVLLEVTTVEGVILNDRIKDTRVIRSTVKVYRVLRVLSSLEDVSVLVEANTPVLKHCTVRTLVTSNARVIGDTTDEDTTHLLGDVTDDVISDVCTLTILDLVRVRGLKLVHVGV
jgi:hypothetical protein